MLAKTLRAPRGVRLPAWSLTTIASMLAPTGDFLQAIKSPTTSSGGVGQAGR